MPLHVTPPAIVRTPAFAQDAAFWILGRATAAFQDRGEFRLALAGGGTPRAVYAELAASGAELPWDKVIITFGDERCVPPDHADSNYRMAHESLLSKVPIPPQNILRVRGEAEPGAAAQEYEHALAARAAERGEERFVHDVILLGLGEDGHTASLFPGSPALAETVRNVIPTIGPKPPPQRITFTFPLIAAAREVCFLVKDPAKEPIIQGVLRGEEYPAARVIASQGVTWLLGE